MSDIVQGGGHISLTGDEGSHGENQNRDQFENVPTNIDDPLEQSNEREEDQEERITEDDSGGGGDTGGETMDIVEEQEKAPSTTSNNEENSKLDLGKQTQSQSKISASESKRSSAILLEKSDEQVEDGRQEDEDPEKRSSDEKMSSGFQIVTEILEELIDHVVQTKEGAGKEEGPLIKDEGVKQSSIITIKSVDIESGSFEIEAELHAELEAEEKATALRKQQVYQENVALYHSLMASRTHLKRRNAFLVKQMYEHYKRKKIDHLFKEMPIANVDMEEKYVRALMAYEEAQKEAIDVELKMDKLVSTLEEKKATVEADLEEEWNNLLLREREVAKGLPVTQSTKQLSDKNVESFIQKKTAKLKEVAKERLVYFKLRDFAAADESYLKSLENLGDNLTLMEYEQLKMQGQTCVEKLEERDADLHRLRCKATAAIQILAEIREKTHTLQEEIEASKVLLHDVNQQLVQTRERVGFEKKRRDMSRSDTIRLRQEAGLLSEPKLLQDYKVSLSQRENLLKQLQGWKSKFESQKQSIVSLRKEIAVLQERSDRNE